MAGTLEIMMPNAGEARNFQTDVIREGGMKNVLAMALAGGRGERMGLLCTTRAKPALSVGSDLKVIDFCLSNCINSGIKNIAVVTGYQGVHLAKYVTAWAASNNGHSRIHILEPNSALYSGTADAVWQNMNLLKRNGFEWIIVLPADHVSKMNLKKLFQFHIAKSADVTVAVARVPAKQAHRYGIVTSSTDGRILEFREKPSMPVGNLASMGIYVFNRQVLLECLADDASKTYSPHDFGYSVIPAIVNRKKVYAYPFTGFWRDIGTIESYYRANLELIDKLPSLNAGRKWHVPSQAVSVPSPTAYNRGHVIHSLIGPCCIIEGRVENSVLSPGVFVGENAVVKNSIIMTRSSVGEYCHLENCIIDEDVKIGAFSNVGLGTGLDGHTFDTIVVVGPGVSVPAYTLVPARAELISQTCLQGSFNATSRLGCSVP